MLISADFDLRGLTAKTAREEKRLAYNVAQAINNTAKTAQADVRGHMQQIFKLRANSGKDRLWLLDRIKLNFASAKKGIVFAELYVDQSKDRLLLAEFEDGGIREAFVGKNVAVPHSTVARVGGTVAGRVDPKLTFKRLDLKRTTTKAGKIQWKGKQRTFYLFHSQNLPLGAILQRVGPGKDDLRVVYSFKSPFQLKGILKVFPIAGDAMKERFKIEWAIANARNPSV